MQTDTNLIRNFGRLPSPPDQRDYQLAAFMEMPVVQMRRVLFGQRKVWAYDRVLDQGNTNHCVGFAFADFGNTLPIDSKQTIESANTIYYAAKEIDGEPESEDGTNLRSGAKAFKQTGRIDAYAFAHTVDEIAAWLLNRGPVVMGTNWYEGMSQPDANGFVKPSGTCVGGHAWLLIGVDWRNPLNRYFVGLNSWSARWGVNGMFNLRASNLARLMREGGEAVTAVELPLTITVTTSSGSSSATVQTEPLANETPSIAPISSTIVPEMTLVNL